MELYLLDKSLGRITAPVNGVISSEWKLRFFECGTFRVVLAMNSGLVEAVRAAEYLCVVSDGGIRCGRIEEVEVTSEGLVIRGKMPECLLADRVMAYIFIMAGRASDAVLSAVSENARGLPLVADEEDSAVIEEMGVFTGAWDNLSSWIYRVLKPYGASFTVTFDPERGTFAFRIVRSGRDSGAIFSSSYGNVVDTEYRNSSASRKNKVYIQGGDGRVVELDESNGEEIRELYCKAADLDAVMFKTTEEYRDALLMRAKEELAGHEEEERIICVMKDGQSPLFGVDYQLGDYCFVADEMTGVFRRARAVGVDEVWENGVRLPVAVTFVV